MRSIWVFVLLATVSLARADDAYWVTVGGAGDFGKSKNIRMAAEDVRIQLSNDHMHVRASFDFRNDGPAETVTMAFPEAMRNFEMRDRSLAIHHFRSWVDGRRVPTFRKKSPKVEVGASAVWLKKVSFSSRGRRHVVCEYDATYPGGDFTDAFYILESGATWKGPIGDCRLTVDWSRMRNRGEPQFSSTKNFDPLPPTARGEQWAKFRFHDLEPDFDLDVRWANCFWNFRVNGSRPARLPLGMDAERLVQGPGTDPLIQLFALPNLLDAPKKSADDLEQAQIDADELFELANGQTLEFPNQRTILIDGKRHRLRRPLKKANAPHSPESRWVYVRDVVTALGGTYRYEKKLDRAVISLPFSKAKRA